MGIGVAIRGSSAFALIARLTMPVRNRFDLSCVYYRDLRGELVDPVAEVPVVMSLATLEDVCAAARLAGPQFVEPFLQRLDDGWACFVAKLDGEVVAYNWTLYESAVDEGDVIRLGPGEIYTSDALTKEGLRGRRIHDVTLGHMLIEASKAGYADAYTMRSELKRASTKALARLGWVVSGRFLRIKLFGRFCVVPLSGSAHPFHAGAASAPSRRDSAAALPQTRTRPAP